MAAGKKAKRNDSESRRSDLDLARSEAQRLRTELRAERAKATFYETQCEEVARARKGAEARAEAAERLARRWEETAGQRSRNESFYSGIIQRIGEPFGVQARTSDDALKLPELVKRLRSEKAAYERRNAELLRELDTVRRQRDDFQGRLCYEQIREEGEDAMRVTLLRRIKQWVWRPAGKQGDLV